MDVIWITIILDVGGEEDMKGGGVESGGRRG